VLFSFAISYLTYNLSGALGLVGYYGLEYSLYVSLLLLNMNTVIYKCVMAYNQYLELENHIMIDIRLNVDRGLSTLGF